VHRFQPPVEVPFGKLEGVFPKSRSTGMGGGDGGGAEMPVAGKQSAK